MSTSYYRHQYRDPTPHSSLRARRLRPIGAPSRQGGGQRGGGGGGGGAGTSTWAYILWPVLFLVGMLAVAALAVATINLSLWPNEMARLEDRLESEIAEIKDALSTLGASIASIWASISTLGDSITALGDSITALDDSVATLNESIAAVAADTTFLDSELVVQNDPDTTKQIRFDLSELGSGEFHNFTWPNQAGTVALVSDIANFINVNTTHFLDSTFRIQNDPDVTKKIGFDLALLSTNVTHIYQWPDKDGVVALLQDVYDLIANATVFLDSEFAIQNDPDTSKEIHFDLALLSTNVTHSYQWPDKGGVVALIQDVDDAIDAHTAFLDSEFEVWNVLDTSKVITLNASLITTNTTRNYLFPDLSGEVVLATGVQTVDDKTLEVTNTYHIDLNKHTFYGNSSRSFSINPLLPWSGDELVEIAAPAFAISTGNWGLPVTNLGVGGAAFDDSAFALYYSGSTAHRLSFDLASSPVISTVRGPMDSGAMVVCKGSVGLTNGISFDSTGNTQFSEILVPDKDGTMALLSDIGPSQTTFSDASFTIINEGDNTKTAYFDASGISTNTSHNYTFPDESGTLALESGLTEATTNWVPVIVNSLGLNTPFMFPHASYIRTQDIVTVHLAVRPNGTSNTFWELELELPIASTVPLWGITGHTTIRAQDTRRCSGFIFVGSPGLPNSTLITGAFSNCGANNYDDPLILTTFTYLIA